MTSKASPSNSPLIWVFSKLKSPKIRMMDAAIFSVLFLISALTATSAGTAGMFGGYYMAAIYWSCFGVGAGAGIATLSSMVWFAVEYINQKKLEAAAHRVEAQSDFSPVFIENGIKPNADLNSFYDVLKEHCKEAHIKKCYIFYTTNKKMSKSHESFFENVGHKKEEVMVIFLPTEQITLYDSDLPVMEAEKIAKHVVKGKYEDYEKISQGQAHECKNLLTVHFSFND